MPIDQNAKNHTRWDPPFHFIIAPILLINFILAVYYTIRQWPIHSRAHLWWIVLSIAWFLTAGLTRNYALKVQDRVIRLEERLRYAALLTPADQLRAHTLTSAQLVALRFASDAELPTLFHRTLAENLTSKQIKQSITTWRPDTHRV